MNNTQRELKGWLSDYCGNVKKYEIQVRKLINQDKRLINKISSAYSLGNTEEIKNAIEEFLNKDQKIWIRTCNNCEKVNYIACKPDERVLDRKCEKCNQFLFQEERKELKKTENKDIAKKCVYCGARIYPPDTIACYLHRDQYSKLEKGKLLRFNREDLDKWSYY